MIDKTDFVNGNALDYALKMDSCDPLAHVRSEFYIPKFSNHNSDSNDVIYMCGNSLGLLSKTSRNRVEKHLDLWQQFGVDGHFNGEEPWVNIEDLCSTKASLDLVGAMYSHEVVYMNSLTVNLHLMLTAFYRPIQNRNKILLETGAFPSDEHAIQTHVASRGINPESALIRVQTSQSSSVSNILIDEDELLHQIEVHASELALVLLPGVQYVTGQVLPMKRIAQLCQKLRIPFGLDLAHAVGNIPLQLHEWGVDFAVWCTYKYLNSGPGSVAGLFLHDKHAQRSPGLSETTSTTENRQLLPAVDTQQPLVRLSGWWGHDRETRFVMSKQFSPQKGAAGFQISNPPVLSIVPVASSIEMIESVGGIDALRCKSLKLTGFLIHLLESELENHQIILVTPKTDTQHGCQVSIRFRNADITKVHDYLHTNGVICDTRKPDILRIAPSPLYNTFSDVFHFTQLLKEACKCLQMR